MSKKIFSILSLISFSILSCNSSETTEVPSSNSLEQKTEVENKNETLSETETKVISVDTNTTITETTQIINTKDDNAVKEDTRIVSEDFANAETNLKANNVQEAIEKEIDENVTKVVTPNHTVWNTLLASNVSSSGKVNYNGMKSNLSKINVYIKQLENLTDQSSWSRNEKLAYWINLYNAATVRLIVQNYPTTSITNINGGKPWDKKVITIGSKSYSLNQIENDIIRPKFKEPRIHFAVNCAAKSCPKIMNSAFTPERLNSQLTKQAKAFINGSKNSITADKIVISKIFEWYAADFGSSVVDYLNKYNTTKINSNASVSYKEYDWSLNK